MMRTLLLVVSLMAAQTAAAQESAEGTYQSETTARRAALEACMQGNPAYFDECAWSSLAEPPGSPQTPPPSSEPVAQGSDPKAQK